MAWKGDAADKIAGSERARLFSVGGFVLVLSLLLLYVASAGSSPSAADVTLKELIFEPTEPVSWPALLHTGSVLQGRFRAWHPHREATLKWRVQSGRLVMALPPGVPLEWLVHEAGRRGSVELVEGGTEFLPVGRRVRTGPVAQPDRGVFEVVLSPRDFFSATVRLQSGRPAIDFLLTPEGDAELVAHTDRYGGYYLCLLIDDEVVNCPLVRTPLSERRGLIELTGTATEEQARLLAVLLLTGPLPTTLRWVGPDED